MQMVGFADDGPEEEQPAAEPEPVPEPSELGMEELAAGDLEVGDLEGVDSLSDELPAQAADEVAALAPDDLAPEQAVEESLAADELVPSETAAEQATAGLSFGAPPEPPAAEPAAADSGLSFESGPSEAADAPAEAGSGFDFGSPQAPSAEPTADLSFGVSEPAAQAPPAEPIADLSFGTPEPAGQAPLAEPGADSGQLLDLLGDDIDAMLDGIIDDIQSDEAGEEPEVQQANTHIELFSHLAVDEFVEVLKVLDRKTVRAGESIVRQGEPGESMYIISTGEVEATVDKDGQKVRVATLKDGNFFGEAALLTGEPRSATVTALTDTELLRLERDRLLELFSRFPGIEAKILLAHEVRTQSNEMLND
jgi:hypothetical protein